MSGMSEQPSQPADEVKGETAQEHDHAAEGQVPDESVDTAVDHAQRQDERQDQR